MNKISKKIVALVTMAAFVLTLVPAAAFAAPESTSYSVKETAYNKATVTINLSSTDKTNLQNSGGKVIVWATDNNDQVLTYTDDVVYDNPTGGVSASQWSSENACALAKDSTVEDAITVDLTVKDTDAGNYKVFVAVDSNGSSLSNMEAAQSGALSSTENAFKTEGAVSVQTSAMNIVNEDGVAQTADSVDVNEPLTAKFALRNSDGQSTSAYPTAMYVWAMENGQVTDALTVKGEGAAENASLDNGGKIWQLTAADLANNDTVTVSFSRPGTYVVYAGTTAPSKADGVTSAVKLMASTECTITVNPANETVKNVKFDSPANGTLDPATVENDGTVTYTIGANAIVNGIADYTLNATANGASKAAANEKFELTSSDPSALALDKAEVTSDQDGKFSIKFKLTKTGEYMIYAKNEDMNFTIKVSAVDTKAEDITTTKSDAQTMLVGSDSRYSKTFTDAVQFKITDASGNEVKNALSESDQPAYADEDHNNAANHEKYVEVQAPEGSTLKAKDIGLYWDSAKSVYTLQYTGTNPSKDLTAGTYTVKVSLKNNKTAEASFTLAKFGTVKDLAVDLTSNNLELGDQVALGSTVSGTVYYVDENGIKVPATSANVVSNIDGKAVKDKTGTTGNAINFELYKSNAYTENLLGTEVTITAYDTKVKKQVVKTLTVVDSVSDYTLAFDSETGKVGQTNTVNVSVVDANGKVVKAGQKMYAYIENSSNADAKVQLTPVAGSTATVTNGKADLKVYSDKETVLDIVVVVTDENGTAYAKTLKYAVGEQDVPVDTSVVMTIGSNDFVVNNEVVSVEDAAPYVANDRTYVPFRALGEALGAEVVWDNDARTVTYTLGKTEVVMTIGEKTYTVNGEEKTMDVAPEITNDRTYVPVRFVGEALGFKVTALSAADGTTASVVFQK